uniref:Sema domain-containing protein n=1 Tax=Latimeria chalumnae TaxID=7897 RepID=H3B6V5_LATCH
LLFLDLLSTNRSNLFIGHRGFLDFRSMFLDEYHDRLFIGGKNTMYSLRLDKNNVDAKEVKQMGTKQSGLTSTNISVTRVLTGFKKKKRERIDTVKNIIYWPSLYDQEMECRMKGKDPIVSALFRALPFYQYNQQTECANYVRLLHPYNRTHLLACGTGAFQPVCAFVYVGHRGEHAFTMDLMNVENGRGKCPHDPNRPFASTFIGGDLYTGLSADFLGRDPVIFRSMGARSAVRTETDQRLLHDPKFVASHLIPDNDDRDNDKVYFFFTEKAMESEVKSRAVYSRVGRVCAVQNDLAGCKPLVNQQGTIVTLKMLCQGTGPKQLSSFGP